MIVYGSKNKLLASEQIYDKCPDCGMQNCITIQVLQKYATLFWIPLFPLKKNGKSHCNYCKMVYYNNLPISLKLPYLNLKNKVRLPIWIFSGAILISIFLVYGFYRSNLIKQRNNQLIVTLQQNDILQVKIKEGFSTIKIENIKGDSVFFKSNKFAIDKESKLYKINNEESDFSEAIEGTTKSALKNKYDKLEILNITRN